MVKGPGTVILIVRSVLARRNLTSSTSTGRSRRIGPETKGDGRGIPGPVHVRACPLLVDAAECCGEPVGIALAPDLAVADDVEARPFLIPDRGQRRRFLRLFQMLGRDAPHLMRTHAGRQAVHQIVPVDEPVRLRIAADDGGGQYTLAHGVHPFRCRRMAVVRIPG